MSKSVATLEDKYFQSGGRVHVDQHSTGPHAQELLSGRSRLNRARRARKPRSGGWVMITALHDVDAAFPQVGVLE